MRRQLIQVGELVLEPVGDAARFVGGHTGPAQLALDLRGVVAGLRACSQGDDGDYRGDPSHDFEPKGYRPA
jgi:hypothetical protein